MNVITRGDLKAKLDRQDEFKLVMVMDTWQFSSMHIPGSLNVSTPEDAFQLLDPNDEIVVY